MKMRADGQRGAEPLVLVERPRDQRQREQRRRDMQSSAGARREVSKSQAVPEHKGHERPVEGRYLEKRELAEHPPERDGVRDERRRAQRRRPCPEFQIVPAGRMQIDQDERQDRQRIGGAGPSPGFGMPEIGRDADRRESDRHQFGDRQIPPPDAQPHRQGGDQKSGVRDGVDRLRPVGGVSPLAIRVDLGQPVHLPHAPFPPSAGCQRRRRRPCPIRFPSASSAGRKPTWFRSSG